MEFADLLIGLSTVTTPIGVCMLLVGVVLGIIIGATPGMSPSMGVALLVPFTFGMEPAPAFILFVAAYQAANYGGSITAIAVNAPGTASSVVTALDGFPLTKQGRPGEALGAAVFCSAFGGFIGAAILIVFAIPIAQAALSFGPAEYFSLAVFGLTTVVSFGGRNWIKPLCGIFLGLLLNTVRMDSFTGEPRFTFGVVELYDGFSFIPAIIGLFALGEVFSQLENIAKATTEEIKKFSGKLPQIAQMLAMKWLVLRSSFIGTFIGVIPGAGSTIASFIAYGQAKRSSRQPDMFGKGSLEGIAASEAANSSSVGGALVPLLSLGIPGSATDAVLLGALTLHGLVAGPALFTEHPDIVYGIFVTLIFANVLILLLGLAGNSLWLQVMRIPRELLLVLIMCLCVVGSFSSRNSIADIWVCLGFGLLGWLLKRFEYQPATVVLGLVLGGMLEENYRRAMLIDGLTTFVSEPISLVFLLLSFGSLALPVFRSLMKRRQ